MTFFKCFTIVVNNNLIVIPIAIYYYSYNNDKIGVVNVPGVGTAK